MGIPHHPMKRFLMKIAAIGSVEERVDWISAPSALGAGAWYGTTSPRRKLSSQLDVRGNRMDVVSWYFSLRSGLRMSFLVAILGFESRPGFGQVQDVGWLEGIDARALLIN